MEYCDFCDQSVIAKQGIYVSESVFVIYPQKPIIPQHFIIFPTRHIQFISELTDAESIDIKNIVQKIFTTYKEKYNCIGYNLTSNNGPREIGQTVPHAHTHIYLRFENEIVSPFKVMNDISLRENLTEDQWQKQKEEARTILNS